MLKVHLECFTECLHVSAEGLVKSLLGEVGGVGGGEDGEDALLQALLRSLRTVGRDGLVSSWGQLGGKIIFPEVSHQLMKKFSQSMFWGHWLIMQKAFDMFTPIHPSPSRRKGVLIGPFKALLN